jgi:glycosyltransferase involved in cell wall biosynthesis
VAVSISVLLSTYNRPEALELAIWGYSAQTDRDFELVVADDGSTDETRRVVDDLRAATGLDIRHMWHEDSGFRKTRILNESIVAAQGDYIIVSDQDCVPRRDFIETHRALAASGQFLSGGRIHLRRESTESLRKEDVISGAAFEREWLADGSALHRPRDLNKVAVRPERAALLDRVTTTRPTWNGHNASAWKADLIAVNGFDERMSYPTEDRELGERLRNFGLRPLQVRHRAVCLHLHHDLMPVPTEIEASNERIRRATRRVPKVLTRLEGLVQGPDWTEYGIVKGARPS